MRLLVLGGAGMLGHKLWQVAGGQIDTWATVRRVTPALAAVGLGSPASTIEGVDVRRADDLEAALDRVKPDCGRELRRRRKATGGRQRPGRVDCHQRAVSACAGTRLCGARHPAGAHQHGLRVRWRQRRLPRDRCPEALDLYGRSKALGEVTAPGCLTVRTSIIGRELSGASGLVEWFLSRRGATADGYTARRLLGLHHRRALGASSCGCSPSTRRSTVCIMCRPTRSTSIRCCICSTARSGRVSSSTAATSLASTAVSTAPAFAPPPASRRRRGATWSRKWLPIRRHTTRCETIRETDIDD